MNLVHRWCCSSQYWAHGVEHQLLPWSLAGVAVADGRQRWRAVKP